MKLAALKIILSVFLLSSLIAAQSTDQKISDVISYINQDTVTHYIQSMQNFGTRFEYHENRKEVANWIKDKYLSMGFEQVELDSFMCSAGWDPTPRIQYNVVATLPGTETPDEIYIIGGHYDSYNNQDDPMVTAPGADDNASGTAGAMETARAIMAAGYQPSSTIQFVAFAAEELMLSGNSGSEYMAASYREQNKNVKLMINHDMIANNPRPLEESMVSVNYYSGYEYLRFIAMELMSEYSAVTPMEGGKDTWTDSRSFHVEGFPAIYYDEYDFSPNYHTSDDVIENCDLEYCTEVIKGGAAMLIHSVESPSIVQEFTAYDVGNGTSIELIWKSNTEYNLQNYEIYFGESENELNLYDTTTDTTIIVESLSEGISYTFGIIAVDADGDESYITTTSAVPNSLPASPLNVVVKPEYQQISLKWSPNEELDLIGYKITKVPQAAYDNIPAISFFTSDTILTDTEIESGVWYDYEIAAIDADSNLSSENPIYTSRAITLDRGILFVNETSSGDGSIGNPSREELEDYYYSLPESNFEMFDINIDETDNFNLAHLGAHQTIIWHVDKSSDVNTYQYLELIQDYLDYGGNILFTGYKPGKAFANSTNFMNEYMSGSFIYDYLKIASSQNSLFALFKGASSEVEGYPNLELDPAKIDSDDGHIKTIEVLTPNEDGSAIYSYQTDFEPSTVQGAFAGLPVGVEFTSEDYNSVIISVPLYYIKHQQAADFVNFVLQNVFDTPTGIENETEEELSNEFLLAQNYPNPFNPTTSIEYQVASIEKVSLKVYDILGREIRTLVNEIKSPGTYKVTFDASELASGTYFYRLTSGSFTETRKMTLMR